MIITVLKILFLYWILSASSIFVLGIWITCLHQMRIVFLDFNDFAEEGHDVEEELLQCPLKINHKKPGWLHSHILNILIL